MADGLLLRLRHHQQIARDRNMVVVSASNYAPHFVNSLIIAFGSTFCAVTLGTLAACGFSRFKVPLADDLLFFILSTRMMPPIGAVNGGAVGKVTWVEHLGDQNHLHVRIGETDLVTLSDPDSGLDHGDPVAIDFVSPLFFDAAGVRIR